MSIEFVLKELDEVEKLFEFLPDVPQIYPEWKHLVETHRVLGAKVHDAKLVAAMNVHGVSRILTFNVADFARFDVSALHPATVWTPDIS